MEICFALLCAPVWAILMLIKGTQKRPAARVTIKRG